MDAEETGPQTYLILPARFELSSLLADLGAVLDGAPVACVRLDLGGYDEEEGMAVGDAVRTVCHERDIAIVVADHFRLAERLGLDGVHIAGTRDYREARKALGKDAIVGVFAGTSRHAGLNAGEMGADYVSFGPVAASGLGSDAVVEEDLFTWWSEMIEVPVLAEGGISTGEAALLGRDADFVGIGPEVWKAEGGPLAALQAIVAGLA